MVLKIAFVSTMLSPFDEGGPGTVAYYLLREFAKMSNVAVTLVVGDTASENEIVDKLGCRFQRIIRLPNTRNMAAYIDLLTKKAKEIWKAFRNVDVVHINSYSILRNFYFPFLASIRLAPLVFSVHGISLDKFFGERAQLAKTVLSNTISTLSNLMWSKVVVNSEYMKSLVSKTIDSRKLCLVRNGVLTDDIRKAKDMYLDGEVKLLFIGKLIPIKGVDLLLQAFHVLGNLTNKKVRLYIAGTGTHESTYRSLASQLQIEDKVQFLGHLPLHRCYELYKSCSLLVLPSYFESAPMTLLEGMAAGTPIVATNVGGVSEIVKDGRNGFLTKKDPAEIAERIHFLINNPEIAKDMSENNIVDTKKYSWRNIALEYINIYNSLI